MSSAVALYQGCFSLRCSAECNCVPVIVDDGDDDNGDDDDNGHDDDDGVGSQD